VTDSLEALMAYCHENGHICPMPPKWAALYEMLPSRPAVPLILGAWHDTSSFEKKQRLAEHIKWAAEHNALGRIEAYLRGLREEDWYHW
jgi:hypothetical protein